MAKLIAVFVFVVLFIAWSANCFVAAQISIEETESESATMAMEEVMITEAPRPKTTTSGGLGGFFKKIGSELNKTGRIIQDAVNNSTSFLKKGFEDVRDRLTPTPTKTTTTTTESSTLKEVKTDLDPVEMEDNPTMMTFASMSNNKETEDDDRPIWDVVEETTMNELDNRFLLDAPTFCPKGQMKLRNGQCRAIA